MPAKYRIIAWVIFTLAFATQGRGQSFVFKNYGTFDGLPSSETYNSIQDSRGYMWFATDRGLARFDGYTFRTFTNEDGMPDNTIFELVEDNENRIWFTTFSSDVGYIKGDSIYQYAYNHLIKSAHPFQIITGFCIDDKNNVFFTKHDDKDFLYRIQSNGKLDSSYTDTRLDTGKIYISKGGHVVYTGLKESRYSEIFLLENKKKVGGFFHVQNATTTVNASASKDGRSMFVCAHNQVLLIKDDTLVKVLVFEGQPLSFFVDDEENFWIGFRHKGLEFYSSKSGYKNCIKNLDKHSVSSINQDKEGGLWFTTLDNGVYYLSPSRPLSVNKNEGLTIAKTKRIINTNENVIVIDENNTILVKNKKSGLFTSYVGKPGTEFDLAYSPYNDVLYQLTFHKYSLPFHKKTVHLYRTKTIYLGKKNIWGVGHIGLIKYNNNGDSLAVISFLNISRTKVMFEKDNGDLLVGALAGLYLYKNNTVFPLKKTNPLFGQRVSDIKPLGNKYVLVATIGKGVYIIDKNNHSLVRHYTSADGLPGSMCNVLLVENDTLVWVGTNRGLCRISHITDPNKTTCITIKADDGLVSNEINDLCIVDKELWVATANGVSIVSKEILERKIPDIPVFISDIAVNGELYQKASSKLSYSQNNIGISFIGFNYQYAGKLQYCYRLKGGDGKWYFTTHRSVTYNSLAPGNYTFELSVVKPNGQINQITTSYSFSIRYPYWSTWWFRALVILLGVVGIYLFIYFRIRFIRAQAQIQNDLNRFRDIALREQMNPHFIYNSLNSIQNFILKNEIKASASFLAKFSQLMRLVFTNTGQELVTVEKDLDALRLYTDLENLRFPNKFMLHVNHDLAGDAARIQIPPLLIQPFVENALLHGLLTKKTPGNVWVEILKENDVLKISITDDGIGREAAALIKEKKDKYHEIPPLNFGERRKSGITTTFERINQVWGKNSSQSNFKIVDLHDQNNITAGTAVSFNLPIHI